MENSMKWKIYESIIIHLYDENNIEIYVKRKIIKKKKKPSKIIKDYQFVKMC